MTQDDRYPGLEQAVALPALLGYLNFSEGRPDAKFQKHFHDAFAYLSEHGSTEPWSDLPQLLLTRLPLLQASGSAAFSDFTQAQAVIHLAFDGVLPAYRQHHRDLLGHQSDADLWQPFFLVRVLEAVLGQRSPWDETARIVGGALKQLNDYVGHRPVAVLENKRKGEIYEHERLRPIPILLRGVGASHGKYHDLVTLALKILDATPEPIRFDAYFDLKLLDELAIDPRAYDFNHPADKRPNYCFGEWDPHLIDSQGYYRRFVIRQLLIDGLWQRAQDAPAEQREEFLFESAAVLAGTLLMASGVCGSGPEMHDSSVSLSTLVPLIAKNRENFYAALLPTVAGPHGARLKQESKLLKQPFGGVRQALNRYLAGQRALQLQQRQLALLFAEIGYAGAARRQAARIPVASVRLLTEMQVLLTGGRIGIDQGRLDDAARSLGAIEDLLKRGISCGALVDPWNILGFGGQYPRFQAMEDAVRDSRIDDLIYVMDQLFFLYGRLLSEGAAAGTFKADKDLAKEMHRLADWWDRFATLSVSDIDHVNGSEATQSAEHVAKSLSRWRARGAGAADLTFWREQLEGFTTAKAFALVVDALLRKQDFRAAASLLMTWLSQADLVPLVDGEHSFHQLALRWMLGVGLATAPAAGDLALAGRDTSAKPQAELLELAVKFFDYLEANAEEFWHVPKLDLLGADADLESSIDEDEDDDEDSIYSAAYEEMVYQDTTDDNVEGEVLDAMPQKDFDLLGEAERLEQRLQFLSTLSRLWNIATRCLRSAPEQAPAGVESRIRAWLKRAGDNERALRDLLDTIHDHEVPQPPGNYDALVEYDRRRSTKERLLNQVIATCVDHALAVGALRGLSTHENLLDEGDAWAASVLRIERAMIHSSPDEARAALPEFKERFRNEPLLYTPLSHGGHPRLILQASLAQMMLRGLVHNLPKQGMLRETYELLRLARSMEAGQTLQGPRITEYDRLFQLGLQAAVDAVVDAAQRERVEADRLVDALETVVEPFAVTWRDHSQTLRVATLELITQDRDWVKMVDFIKRYGRELFHAKFLAMANLRGILLRGVGPYLNDLESEPDPLHPLKLIDELDNGIARSEAERILQIILQTLIENYDHLRDYNATTTQSDYGDNLYRLFDYLRLKARYERAAWLLKPLNLVHETLARRDGTAAAVWRERVEAITHDSAEKYVDELARLEKTHGIRLATIRDRLEERFVRPLVLDRLCALIEPALEYAKTPEGPESVSELEKELEPLASTPSGVGLDVPAWLLRLQGELERVHTSQSDLGNLAETMFQVPRAPIPFAPLIEQLGDWEKRSREEAD